MYNDYEDELEVADSNPAVEINDALKQINVSGKISDYNTIEIFGDIDRQSFNEGDIFNADYSIGDALICFEATVRDRYDDEENDDKITGRNIVITKIECNKQSIEVDIEL